MSRNKIESIGKGGRRAQYVVVGHPIAHSRSPEIHQAFAAQFDDSIDYKKVDVAPGEFAAYADEFARGGGRGMNVTVPFKGDAYNYVDRCDVHAAAAGAVNTIVFGEDGTSAGYNTDGVGLLNDMQQRHSINLAGLRILIIGAGGATAGVINPLLNVHPAELIIANRTLSRAENLVEHHKSRLGEDIPLSALDLAELGAAKRAPRVDVVINATSFALNGGEIPIAKECVTGTICYDMSYGPAALFQRWAVEQGAVKSFDGLGMLVEQAAQSFYIWRKQMPQTEPVVAAIRASMSGD